MKQKRMPPFRDLVEKALSFEGMMHAPQIAVFEFLLADQLKKSVKGDMLECGVYKGRSASVMLAGCQPTDTLYLIDASPHPEIDKLGKIGKNFEIHKGKSEEILPANGLKGLRRSLRFTHHDASHSYGNVIAELRFIEQRLSDNAVVVMDDFFSWAYPQVTAATIAYISNPDCRMEMFLIGDNKAYLCRKKDFDYYARLVLDGLVSHMNERGFQYCIARTDDGPFRSFGLAAKRDGDAPDRYGEQLWGDRYYQV